MAAKHIAVTQRENYVPTRFTEFLWWLSTAEREILLDSVVDRNRYRIIGMTVLGTWLFATLTWSYFFSTITGSIMLSLLLGLFMGFIILTIDRALIKGITKFNKRKITPLLFRGVLALTIGAFMAQPAVLYMFDKEIRLQASLDNEKKKQAKRTELENLFKTQKAELLQQQAQLNARAKQQNEEVSQARQNYLAESDAGRIGLKDIAMAKRNEYQKLDEAYVAAQKANKPKLDSIESAIGSIEGNIKKAEAEFATYLNDGFLTRVEALNNILKSSPALQYRYYLILFILMLIELMPVIAKIMLPSGSYDEKARLREEMETELAVTNIQKEKMLKELYNQMAFDNDKEAIHSFFDLTREERNEKISAFSKKWKNANDESLDGLWEKMKREILTKQEN